MRGAVSAGMAAAIKYVGLEDAFDVVYGSSAGAIVGAYFVSRQLPLYGAQIYYDTICSMPEDGQRFIDLWALRHHPYFRLGRRKPSEFYGNGARPVLLLDRLLDSVMCDQRPLDWAKFWRNYQLQPLKPVASSLTSMRSRTLDDFSSLDELLDCLRASARVPGIAGNPVEIDGEFYADGLLFEPIPFKSAVRDGCTDILVLRTKPDAMMAKMKCKPGLYERHIAGPYFNMFHKFSPRAAATDFLNTGGHLSIYQDDVVRLNYENENPRCEGAAAIFTISPPTGAAEVGQLESRAARIYDGVRSGFASAYDALSPFGTPTAFEEASLRKKTNGRVRGKEKSDVDLTTMTAGQRASRWVFSEEELNLVLKRHEDARKGRRIIKKAMKKNRRQASAASRGHPNERAGVSKGGIFKKRVRRYHTDTTIEEHYFVG